MMRKLAFAVCASLLVGAIAFSLVALRRGAAFAQQVTNQQSSTGERVDRGDLFAETVAPALTAHCVTCHNERDRKGGLSLQTGEAALAGGNSGQIIYAGDPASSYLLDLITPHDGKSEMPKGGPPLDEETVMAIRQWIADGAHWPESATLKEPTWWSFAPLARPEIPNVPSGRAAWAKTPIDAFIAAAHEQHGLQPAEEAERRTLIRRLSFDLLGLPPTPEEIDEFVNDNRQLAYERLVERTLSSPRYGERWARHWLDVVHYGETHGYDKDKPRPNAWPYRDYVIRAFNADKPYDQFAREQIAGDVFAAGTRDGAEALGFIAAGPWDFIGHVELPETKIDGQVARHLDRDDMVQNTMTSFMSLTAGCAQCHDHKFDPITQREYYQLQAVFAAVDRTDLAYDTDDEIAARRAALTNSIASMEEHRDLLRRQIAEVGGQAWADINAELARLEQLRGTRPPQYGYHSAIEPSQDAAKWVQVDLGGVFDIDRIQMVPCHDDFNGIGAGFGFPVRYKIEISADPDFTAETQIVVDQTGADVANPGTRPREILVGKSARYLRVTATRLAPRAGDYIFAVAELRVFDDEENNVARGKSVSALDSIEAPIRWGRANLVDGLDPHSAADPAEIEILRKRRESLFEEIASKETRTELAEVEESITRVTEELAQLPLQTKVYAAGIHNGEGNFRGTGPDGGAPRNIHVLIRGDVTSPAEIALPEALSCLPHHSGKLDLSPESSDRQRRAALAAWLSADDNPLLWRSIANRVWQYHFGRGLVNTPNDFGRMGGRPSHPELLDWLAVELRDSGGSIKHLQRLIVASAVYRQTSRDVAHGIAAETPDPSQRPPAQQAIAPDPDNIYLSRMNRRRLEAEAIHDVVLAMAGKLDGRMEGESYRDFVIEKPEHSPHYRYDLYDPNDPRSHRRAVYRMVVRSQTQPLLTALDCADPSMQVGKRNESNTPLQALSMLNNKFILVMARHFADRMRREHSAMDEQIQSAFRLAVGRTASERELQVLTKYTREHGLENACRVILNLNEFQFVD